MPLAPAQHRTHVPPSNVGVEPAYITTAARTAIRTAFTPHLDRRVQATIEKRTKLHHYYHRHQLELCHPPHPLPDPRRRARRIAKPKSSAKNFPPCPLTTSRPSPQHTRRRIKRSSRTLRPKVRPATPNPPAEQPPEWTLVSKPSRSRTPCCPPHSWPSSARTAH